MMKKACEERIHRKIQDIRVGCNLEDERRNLCLKGLINTSESTRAGFCLSCMEMSYDKFLSCICHLSLTTLFIVKRHLEKNHSSFPI